jgi:hypothetical protein
MNLHGFWQSVAATAVCTAIGAFVGYLKKKGFASASPVFYGLGAAAFAGLVVVTAVVFFREIQREPPVTTDTVEESIGRWLHDFNVSTAPLDENDSYFGLKVTYSNGYSITVRRPRKFGRYLFATATISATQEEQDLLDKFPKLQRDIIEREIQNEIATVKLSYESVTSPFRNMTLIKRMPIGPSLNEASFMEGLDELNLASILTTNTLWERLYTGSAFASWLTTQVSRPVGR